VNNSELKAMVYAVVSECDAMHKELEGIGLSYEQVCMVKVAFMRGMAVGEHFRADEYPSEELRNQLHKILLSKKLWSEL